MRNLSKKIQYFITVYAKLLRSCHTSYVIFFLLIDPKNIKNICNKKKKKKKKPPVVQGSGKGQICDHKIKKQKKKKNKKKKKTKKKKQ